MVESIGVKGNSRSEGYRGLNEHNLCNKVLSFGVTVIQALVKNAFIDEMFAWECGVQVTGWTLFCRHGEAIIRS